VHPLVRLVQPHLVHLLVLPAQLVRVRPPVLRVQLRPLARLVQLRLVRPPVLRAQLRLRVQLVRVHPLVRLVQLRPVRPRVLLAPVLPQVP
jgi:hypothetical protein